MHRLHRQVAVREEREGGEKVVAQKSLGEVGGGGYMM